MEISAQEIEEDTAYETSCADSLATITDLEATNTAYNQTGGTIIGVTDAMEYRMAGDLAWIPITGTTLTGLAAGTYEIRYRAVPGKSFASHIAVVTVGPDVSRSVTGVSINRTNITMVVGGTETLSAAISPPDATNKAVAWRSSDENIATVDENGMVTAISEGTAIITLTTVDGGFEASCIVTIINEPLLLSSITRTVVADTEFNVICSFNNMMLSDDTVFRIKYNTTHVELVDFAAQTQGRHISVGLVMDTNLEILYHNVSTGELIFRIHNAIPSDQAWSGVVTILRFEAKITGYTTIYFEQMP